MLNAIGRICLALARHLKSGGVIVNEHVLDREQTRRHVDVLSRSFDFIHLNDLPSQLCRRGKKPFCLLTFDDGKRSNATAVAPELERLGVPAVFFVVSGSLDDQAPLWFDRYRALQQKLGAAPSGLSLPVLKQLPHALLIERIGRACSRYGIDANVRDDDVGLMSWEQVRQLRRRGFSIGAHGHTHTILTRENKAAAFESIERSIVKVSEEIGEPCPSFAFPNGNYTAELAQHAIRCGAKTVMTTEPTWVDQRFPLWRLPRLQIFGNDNPGKVRLKAAVAAAGCILKNPDGTGRLYRVINRLARRDATQNPIEKDVQHLAVKSQARTEAEVNVGLD
jgi:peptidoglycan/xylan/chitin deacetylase (PgdA/CDA1 family)